VAGRSAHKRRAAVAAAAWSSARCKAAAGSGTGAGGHVKADGRINGVVKVTKDPRGPTGPNLKYETSSQHSDIQSNPHDDLTRTLLPG
jgi:hypothetical protein